MNFKKTLMAAAASLFVIACSNDHEGINEPTQPTEAIQALTFSLDLAKNETFTRTPATATSADKSQALAINKIEVNLTAENFAQTDKWITIYGDGASKDVLYQVKEEAGKTKKEFTIFGLNNPSNLKVRINHTEKPKGNSYASIDKFQVADAQNMPAYGATETFAPYQGTTEINGKKYDKIKTTVAVNIPVARLELSGIEVNSEVITSINLNRIFINNVLTQMQANNAASTFTYSSIQKLTEATKGDAIIKDLIASPVLEGDTVTQNVYAYSIFPNASEEMPQVTLEFDNVKYTTQSDVQKEARYAVITKFNGNENFQFEAGKIYRIKKMMLTEKNIGADITGNSQHALEVILDIANWNIQDIESIEWN